MAVQASTVRLPERIEGHGLVLRRWRTSDSQALSQAVTEAAEHLRPWMAWVAEEPLGPDERRARLERWEADWAAGGDVVMGVFTAGQVSGGCGLHRRIGPTGLEIGYWIHPAFLRQGHAAAVAELLTEASFSVPGIDHVEIHHDRANRASAGIPRKLGFEFLGETPEEIVAPGEEGVEWTWRMDRLTWRSLHPAPGAA